jgi:hypothetical protein
VNLRLLRPKQCAPEHTLGVEESNLTNNVSSTNHHLQAYLEAPHRAQGVATFGDIDASADAAAMPG